MSKRFLIGMLSTVLVAAMIGFATMALWTSQASNDNNIFSTGTLIIGAPDAGSNTGTINAVNIAPGWSSSYSVQVNNLGTLAFTYTVTTLSSGDAALSALLDCDISVGGTNMYSGKCNAISSVALGSMTGGASANMDVTVSLSSSIDNTDLDPAVPHSSTIDFTFDATQI